MQQLWLGPYYLSLPSVLAGLGIIGDELQFELTLSDKAGGIVVLTPTVSDMVFSGFPKLHSNNSDNVPVYLQKNNDNYWSTLLSDKKLLYVQFNDVKDKSSLSLKDFNLELVKQITRDEIKHFVLDLRHNSGGYGSITPPMVATAIFFDAYKPDGKLFVLVGRNTFSAGHDLLMKISRFTDAIIVGEPSGTRPNALGEAGWFNLPYSNQTGILSSQFRQEGGAEDHRIWVAPDVPVSLSSLQYLKGQDPSLEAVYRIIDSDL
ncbi:MAG: C-terminal processing protease CtpA/Prc [Granulosicoccus sp.]|jgi:C-terminal processing protease CtpA/Prc